MAVLKNELVWSHSRAKTFQWCRRAYWYTYYGSWGGWEADAPEATRNAWLQKKLTSVPAWVGTLVHGIAENLLKEAIHGENPLEDEAADRAVRTANRQIRESERQLGRPGRATRFAEHYYGEGVTDVEWEAAYAEIERQVRVLFEHRIFRRLLQVPERILDVEELRRFAVALPDAPAAEVYVALDVLVSDGRGGVVIVD
ncbi:MAG TPA: PD-(D/E)XK nuclease family protein, partial [Myxococcota bacterium]|nr:PD-(D/E)XK nuclease family protein [Myxococcota bacterium]